MVILTPALRALARRVILWLGLLFTLAALLVTLLLAAAGVAASSLRGRAHGGTPERGIAKYYSPGLFRLVAANRGIPMRRDVAGYASVPDCGLIGHAVQAAVNGHAWESYEVLDCSAPQDRPRHLAEGLVIEIDYRSAIRTGIAPNGHGPAEVLLP